MLPSWLDSVDKSVILTLLAKKRSELHLLRSEAKRPGLAPPNVSDTFQFPDYDVGTRGSGYTTPSKATQVPPDSASSSRPPSRRARNNSELHNIEEGIGDALAKLNTSGLHSRGHSENGFQLPGQLSPLSPTFGPRRGHVQIGTLERRRASVPANVYMSQNRTPTSPACAKRPPYSASLPAGSHCLVKSSWEAEQRILWEAAWTEIERNLEAYARRFEDGNSDLDERDNDDVWRELVNLRNDKMEVLDILASRADNTSGMRRMSLLDLSR